jgi:hypothetical protein
MIGKVSQMVNSTITQSMTVRDYVRLNPKYFDIKSYRTFNMANIVQEAPNLADPTADVYKTRIAYWPWYFFGL